MRIERPKKRCDGRTVVVMLEQAICLIHKEEEDEQFNSIVIV